LQDEGFAHASGHINGNTRNLKVIMAGRMDWAGAA
jgi:hypothetical protein